MNRARRLEPIHELARGSERNAAVQLAKREQQLTAARVRELELLRYVREYQDNLVARAMSGLQARKLREYQNFLARLNQAAQAQQVEVARALSECELLRTQLHGAVIRRKALGTVIEQAKQTEHRAAERRTQRESDERASQSAGVPL
jgi:flagellar FliJ protein